MAVAEYFVTEYESDAAWAGVLWIFLSQLGYGIFETETRVHGRYEEYMTGVGFSLMTWVNEIVFGTIFILFTLAYIHEQQY